MMVGLSLKELMFSDDGGLESERTYVKQLVQKYVSDGSSEDLFNEDEMKDSTS